MRIGMKKEGYILLPQPIAPEAMEILRAAEYETVIAGEPTLEVVRPLLQGACAIILRTGIKITDELMAQAPVLCVIARTGAGVDNVEVPAATRRGILVTAVPGVNTTQVAEHTFALFLALAKHLPRMDREVRRGNFAIRFANLPRTLRGMTLGLVGFGKIGSEVARMGREAFGLEVLAHDPFLSDKVREALAGQVEFAELARVFREADLISLHLPLTAATRGLVGAPELALMKPGAFLVNTSRGGVLDEEALVDCLKENRIAGAGLDVFDQEPPAPDSPLFALDNLILTPHSAALTREGVARLAGEAVTTALKVLRGEIPREVLVNPEVLSLRDQNEEGC
jgi:D-3-phosphoglycerate dehydrogenase